MIATIMIILRKLAKYKIHNAIQMHYMSVIGVPLAGILLMVYNVYDPRINDKEYVNTEIICKGFLLGLAAWGG